MSKKTRPNAARRNPIPWIITGVAGLVLIVVLIGPRKPGHVHPEPRTDAAALSFMVMPPGFFANNQDIARVYQIAQQIPTTLDGMYCYCVCLENFGHRSLLQCFQSQHAAGCDVCLEEAIVANDMLAKGQTLADIRAAVDAQYART